MNHVKKNIKKNRTKKSCASVKESSSVLGPASNMLQKPNFRAMWHYSFSTEDYSILAKILSSVTQ